MAAILTHSARQREQAATMWRVEAKSALGHAAVRARQWCEKLRSWKIDDETDGEL